MCIRRADETKGDKGAQDEELSEDLSVTTRHQ